MPIKGKKQECKRTTDEDYKKEEWNKLSKVFEDSLKLMDDPRLTKQKQNEYRNSWITARELIRECGL